jgi:hypothetical protein
MTGPTIAFVNASTLIDDATIATHMAAIQEDIGTNGPLWNVGASFVQVAKGDPPPAGAWQQVYLDDTEAASALGFHELTAEGLPIAKVFVRTTQQDGASVSRVSSHETAEMLVDPWLNRYTPTRSDGRSYCIEVGDLLSLDSQGRPGLGGVMLSGIALPAAYYDGYGTRYDIGGLLTAPLPKVAPAEGAFLMWWGGSGWETHATFGADATGFLHRQPGHGSRRHRRIMGPANWRRSTVEVAP